MNKEKIKIISAWISLIILIAFFIYMNHIKYFKFEVDESTMQETPVENSTAEAIELALTDIVNNFNSNPLIDQNKNEGTDIKATLNNYSIYISYTKNEKTTTYEFNYSNLILNLTIANDKENITKFNKIYEILIKSVQQRLKNEEDITNLINNHINENINYDGLEKQINNNTIEYTIDITKKLKERGSE